MQVMFMCEEAAVKLEPKPGVAMISITNPGDVAPLRPGWCPLLRVALADAGYDESAIASHGRMWPLSSKGFPEKRHALQIHRFLDELPPNIELLVVHCGAGISRSGAVAKYAAERYGQPFVPAAEGEPNETLYRLLKDPEAFDKALAKYAGQRPSSLLSRLAGLFGKA